MRGQGSKKRVSGSGRRHTPRQSPNPTFIRVRRLPAIKGAGMTVTAVGGGRDRCSAKPLAVAASKA